MFWLRVSLALLWGYVRKGSVQLLEVQEGLQLYGLNKRDSEGSAGNVSCSNHLTDNSTTVLVVLVMSVVEWNLYSWPRSLCKLCVSI